MQPLVSIVIPNYNNVLYLEQCLESCLQQTYNNIEIVVVDDCSTDNSLEILKKFEQNCRQVKVIQNRVNQKVSKTRHIGIEHSQGSWITTLDSDDIYISKDKVASEMDVIRKNKFNHNIIAYSGIVTIDRQGKPIKKIMNSLNVKEGFIFDEIITRNCPIPRDFMFSKSLYFEVGGFDFNIPIYEDWDLKIRLSSKAKFIFSGIDAIGYRKHSQGLSSVSKTELNRWLEFVFFKNARDIQNFDALKNKLHKNVHANPWQKFMKKIKTLIKLY